MENFQLLRGPRRHHKVLVRALVSRTGRRRRQNPEPKARSDPPRTRDIDVEFGLSTYCKNTSHIFTNRRKFVSILNCEYVQLLNLLDAVSEAG